MLSLLGSIYGKVADVRNRLYDLGVFETYDIGARTISIGNITTGGTGKTPLVAYVAEILAARSEKVCILTRGYGRENPKTRVLVSDGDQICANARESGDEPYELANKLLSKAIVIADSNRVAAAEWAKRKFGVTAFVLDDGFQHRKAKRDVDIVCVDATNPFGGGKVLPAGRLREPLANLKRADVVVITRANLIEDISNLKSQISDLKADAAVFVSNNRIASIRELEEFNAETRRTQRKEETEKVVLERTESQLSELKKKAVFAFCGLGNPENFFGQLKREGYRINETKAFRDHYIYTQYDVSNIESLVRQKGGGIIFTTAKDAVKLSDLKFEIPCYVVKIEIKIDDPEAFAALL